MLCLLRWNQEFLVIRPVRQWGNVTGVELLGPDGNRYELKAAMGDATYWLTDADDSRPVVSNVAAMDDVEAFEVIGRDVDRLQAYLNERARH
jgi:hypothetical protein